MKIKNIISILLAVALIISLSGCAAQSVPASIDEEGRFIYSIVRPGGTPITLVDDSARIIRSAIKENFGVTLTYIKDTALEEFNSDYEILIGETNREETAKAIKLLDDNKLNNNNDFIVAVINNKICIYSKNDSVLYTAAEWFVNNFCQSLESWQKLKTGYKFIYEHDVGSIYANKANGRDVGTYDVVLPRYASYLYGMVAEDIIAHYKSIGYGPVWYEDIIDKEVDYEILIGDCDRPASKSVTVEGNNYVIKVIGNKIVAKGGNDLATREAALKLLEESLKGKETGTGFDWSDGYTINGKYVGDKASDYTLNWFDEFEGSTIDLDKWGDYGNYANNTTHPSQNGGTLYWQNCYGESCFPGEGMMDLMYTSDGNLHLLTQNINNKDFGGALISSYPTMLYRYGLIEVREKFAPEPAACSVWQNGANTSGQYFDHWTVNGVNQNRASMTEIDIFEDYGQNKYFTSTLHNWWSNNDANGNRVDSGHSSISGNAKYKQPDNNTRYNYDSERYGDTLIDDYHLMACYWDGKRITFAVDGKSYLTVYHQDNNAASIRCLMNYVILSCRMSQGGYCSVTYSIDEHPKVCEALIDYVRIYQREDQSAQMLTTTTEKKPNNRVINIKYPNNPLGNAY